MGELLLDALDRAAGGAGGLTVVTADGEQTLPWAELHRRALRLAGGLQARGLGRGSAVGLLGRTGVEIVTALRAAWLAGAAVTVLTPPPRHDPPALAAACAAAARTARLDAVLVCPPFEDGLAAVAGALAADGRTAFTCGGDEGPYRRPELTADDTALHQLTSGTTGEPKAVRITHGNLAAHVAALRAASRHEDICGVLVSWLPLFHDMGLIGYLTVPMACGACRVVLSRPEDFLARPLSWPELLSRHRATATAAPSFAYGLVGRLLPRAGELDLSSLRYALCGVEPIDPAALETFVANAAPAGLRPEAVVPAYGMAEATLGVALAPPGRGLRTDDVDPEALASGRVLRAVRGRPARRLPLLGPPVPGIEVRVVPPGGDRPVGERELGELWIRGPSVTRGYLDGPDAHREGGWFATGDLGYLTGGELVVCGRRREVVVVAGRNVLPHDVERAAETVPGVRRGRVAAFRGADGPGVERLVVAVEAGAPDRDLPGAVASAVLAAVGVRPHEVLVLPPATLPKTSSGKMRRTEIRRRHLAGSLAVRS